jgi:hypothetical protein
LYFAMEFFQAMGMRFSGLALLVSMVVLQPFGSSAAPGSTLQFDGVGAFVQVTNNSALNAFPFTVSAWFSHHQQQQRRSRNRQQICQ